MATLSEAFTAHPVRLHYHPHLLDFSSLRELPDSHAWPTLRDHPSSGGGDGGDRGHPDPVPIIDLGDPDVIRSIARACETWGVFQVTGHGVPAGLLDRVESECQRLFTLPAERKLMALRQPDGISGYGLARISSFFSKLMWSEGFTVVGSPVEHARKLWPQDHVHFWYVMPATPPPHAHNFALLATRLLSPTYVHISAYANAPDTTHTQRVLYSCGVNYIHHGDAMSDDNKLTRFCMQ